MSLVVARAGDSVLQHHLTHLPSWTPAWVDRVVSSSRRLHLVTAPTRTSSLGVCAPRPAPSSCGLLAFSSSALLWLLRVRAAVRLRSVLSLSARPPRPPRLCVPHVLWSCTPPAHLAGCAMS
ncbi:hypothetical protein ZWY2020_048367 [Hordeum vulgare]|nr:hypothetical protein ZWY2020_048367 [Hordeum vulgare]